MAFVMDALKIKELTIIELLKKKFLNEDSFQSFTHDAFSVYV